MVNLEIYFSVLKKPNDRERKKKPLKFRGEDIAIKKHWEWIKKTVVDPHNGIPHNCSNKKE